MRLAVPQDKQKFAHGRCKSGLFNLRELVHPFSAQSLPCGTEINRQLRASRPFGLALDGGNDEVPSGGNLDVAKTARLEQFRHRFGGLERFVLSRQEKWKHLPEAVEA